MIRRKKQPSPLAELHITLPQGWGELTAAQVSRVAYHLAHKTDDIQYLVNLALEFADLQPRGANCSPDGVFTYSYYHRSAGRVVLNAEQVAAMARAIEWATGEPEPMQAPELDGYCSPDQRLFGITLEQFVTADNACNAFASRQNIEALRVMVAALYPRSKSYDPEKLQVEAARLSFLPMWQLEAVVLWYIGAKKFLMQKYQSVFSGGEEQGGASGAEILLGLLSSVNEGRVVDNEKLKSTDIHEILYELNRKIRNAQKTSDK